MKKSQLLQLMSRYENKYVIPAHKELYLDQALMDHPLSFARLYEDRQINNVYFDTTAYKSWRENIDGAPDRSKYRVRWYGAIDEIRNPILENKIKTKEMGTKTFHDLAPAYPITDLSNLTKDVNQAASLEVKLVPSMANWYVRSYYQSIDEAYRLTIDRELHYCAVTDLISPMSHYLQEVIIVEVKFEKDDIANYDLFSSFWPFRQSKYSKYSKGLKCLHSM